MPYRFMRYPEGKTKAVTFSYDDGVIYDLRLAEVCDKYGIKVTFNVCSSLVGDSDRLSADDMRDLVSRGHEIAVHGHEHKSPALCTDMETVKDVLLCRESFEEILGTVVNGMAYADCAIARGGRDRYEETRALLKSLGIVYSRSLGGDNNGFELPTDWLEWMPTVHHDNPNSLLWAEEFTSVKVEEQYNSYRNPRLFYVWGHSIEFENHGNWEHLTELCEALSGRDDVWYATNIEICRYAKAFERLEFNAANTAVFNPTSFDIWFECRGAVHCVKAGQLLRY